MKLANRYTSRIELLETRRLLSDGPPTPSPTAGTAVVHGVVFRDLNQDGIRQTTEPGQANVKVYLDYNNNGVRDGDAEPIVITDANGAYSFAAAKAPATIPVRLLLTGTNFIQTRPANNAARTVTTTIGGTFELESFGVAEPTVTPPLPTLLTGIVYTDRNNDGMRESTELGRANVVVYIDTNNDGAHEDGEPLATTNGDGRYTFGFIDNSASPVSGLKTLRLLLTGTHLHQTEPANGAPVHATVVPRATVEADPFGVVEVSVVPPPPPPTVATVTGNVFTDLNQNAVRDPNEVGRPNVHVYLDLNDDGMHESIEPVQVTDSTGHYVFSAAPVRADLHIRLDLVGTPLQQTFPADNAARVIATVAGQTYVDQNFGVHEVPTTTPPTTGIIRGRVFNDVNHDGKQEVGDAGVPNRIVYLDLNNDGSHEDGERTAVTDNLGNYIFTAVAPNTYDVRLIRGELVQTSPPDNGANVAVVTAGGNVGDLFFGTYRVPVAVTAADTGGTPIRPVASIVFGTKVKIGSVAADVLA